MKVELENTQYLRVLNIIKSLIPKEILLTVSEWTEKNRILTNKVAKKTGKFSFDYAPYTREIADKFSKNDPAREIAIMKGVQLCFTTSVFENTIAYSMAHDPCAMMLVTADKQLLKEYKKVKIDNLIDCSGLRDRIVADTGNKNSRRQGDTATMIEFIGGFLRLVGSHSDADLRSFPIKKLFLDEIDAYKEIKGAGHPIDLAVDRTNNYADVCKIGYISTPLFAHDSNINKLYLKGNQKKWFVPCPFCKEKQELIFFERDGGLYPDEKGVLIDGIITKPYGIIFDSKACKEGDYSSVGYKCKHCGEKIQEHYKYSMNLAGEWRAIAKSKKPFFESYHIAALCSNAFKWWMVVEKFLDAGTDPRKLQVFWNNVLGLPFEDTAAGVEITVVSKLRDDKVANNSIPEGVLFLTSACDVQDDRLEVEIKGWGKRWRNWGIDHRIIYGNTSDSNDPCWNELAAIKDEMWNGKQIELMLVDSGDGEKMDLIYSFCSYFGENVIYPCKGFIAAVKTKEKFKLLKLENYELHLVEIYVDLYKNQLSRWFNQEWRVNEDYPDGWITFAKGYSDEYLRQLTTEKKIKKTTPGGLIKTQWVQKGRNEAFDLNVYNLCCAELFIQTFSKVKLELEQANAKAVFDYLAEGK